MKKIIIIILKTIGILALVYCAIFAVVWGLLFYGFYVKGDTFPTDYQYAEIKVNDKKSIDTLRYGEDLTAGDTIEVVKLSNTNGYEMYRADKQYQNRKVTAVFIKRIADQYYNPDEDKH